ncbi:MAG TPA: ubiquitin-like protein Pup [Acidimicrobiia bacterium]|nr:ubiquitin-like protein Pup [Acidimicrobiia bacterium]
MTERERAQERDGREAEVTDEAATTSRGEDVAGKIDDLLDEIDSVLEENAEEFVKNYVQKGGE